MREYVLAVAGPELQAAQELDQLGVQPLNASLEHPLLAELDDVGFELGFGLVVHLFDPSRMNSPILEELVEREPRDLPPDPVKSRQHDRTRRVVDDEIDAREVFQR